MEISNQQNSSATPKLDLNDIRLTIVLRNHEDAENNLSPIIELINLKV